MSYNLFLDDNFTPEQIANLPKTPVVNKSKYRNFNWLITKTYDEFVKIITENGLPEYVSFDHDLAPEHYEMVLNDDNWNKSDDEIEIDYSLFQEKTGWHAAKWLIKYCNKEKQELPICLVHSQNSVGHKNIINLLF